MLKKIFSVRTWLTIGLICSIILAGWHIYYKVQFWGFDLTPNQQTPVWTIESHLTFKPTEKPLQISFFRPDGTASYKILDESVIAKGYTVEETPEQYILTAQPKKRNQSIYYRILVYDNQESRGKIKEEKPVSVQMPMFDDTTKPIAQQIITLSKALEGNPVQQLIRLLNHPIPNETVVAFMPERKNSRETAEILIDLLALQKIPARVVRGMILEEGKKTTVPDVMLEAYDAPNKRWITYDIQTGKKGVPENFIILQRGGKSLVDVRGGVDSLTKYSVLKSVSSSLGMARYRAKAVSQEKLFSFSIYNLPIEQQNALKWLMIYPLAILIVVILRNVVGLKTMGTFTPMLIALALVQTGFVAGLIGFGLVVGIGCVIRNALSRLNLLLVPRISAVVIFVILIIQVSAILGYNYDWDVATGILFFPIIIMAWIIERASIIWEEEGFRHAAKEVINSVIVAIITYFVIVNPSIRHIMFVFNELNLVILFIVMLLGTYTGYRLTELKRFAPLVRKKDTE